MPEPGSTTHACVALYEINGTLGLYWRKTLFSPVWNDLNREVLATECPKNERPKSIRNKKKLKLKQLCVCCTLL
jgi:hypothetical protein